MKPEAWYWDLDLSPSAIRTILADDQHPQFVSIAGRLLARVGDPNGVFRWMTPLAFCRRFSAIRRVIEKDAWTKERAALWQATYERYRREFRGVRLRERESRSLDEFTKKLLGDLRTCRRRAGLSQAALAKLMGCSQQFVSGVESGREKLTIEFLKRYTEAVGSSCDVIIVPGRSTLRQESKVAEEYADLERWIGGERDAAQALAQKHGFTKGLVEVIAYLPDAVLNARQDAWRHPAEGQTLRVRQTVLQNALRDAMEQTQIHTFGWPIGPVIDREEFKPKIYKDGVRTQIIISDHVDFGSFLDYWALRTDIVLYMLMSLFEDMRAEGKLFLDTRIVRTAETILRIGRLYEALGVPGHEMIVIKIRYRGLRGRVLSVADPARRMAEQRISVEDEVETSIRERLEHLTPKLVGLVNAAVSDLTILFDGFVPDKERVVKPLVEQFLKGRI